MRNLSWRCQLKEPGFYGVPKRNWVPFVVSVSVLKLRILASDSSQASQKIYLAVAGLAAHQLQMWFNAYAASCINQHHPATWGEQTSISVFIIIVFEKAVT